VYWADVLYEQYDENEAAYEHVEDPSQGAKKIDMSWRAKLAGQEKNRIDTLAATLRLDAPGDDNFEPPESDIGVEFERIPLPWWLKRQLMEIFLRDVHHYLFNAAHNPRPGVHYQVQDEIRHRLIAALKGDAQKPGPHIVVSHSMGTVIAYDCLKRVPECPRVDGLMTIGSPLGLDEIQDLLKPQWTRHDGFPSERVASRWVNVYDHFDPVAGFDPNCANDYQRGSVQVVEDFNEQNSGKWRHNISKYLRGTQLRSKLASLLGR
jgi:predicted alpha/beta hydrolase family esterase